MSAKNQIIINDDHYPQHNTVPKRPKNALQAEFEALALAAAEYLQKLSQRRGGHLREQMQNIISLTQDYSLAEISAAMERALGFGAIGYSKLKSILQKQSQAPESLPTVPNNKCTRKLNDLPYQVQVERLAKQPKLNQIQVIPILNQLKLLT